MKRFLFLAVPVLILGLGISFYYASDPIKAAIYRITSSITTKSVINISQNNYLRDGLIGFWTFNGPDVTGTTATDVSVNGNNGTLTSGPTVAPGIIGQALNLDGVNDYVDLGAPSSLSVSTNGANGWSMSAWVLQTGSLTSNFMAAKRSSLNVGGYLFGATFARIWHATTHAQSTLTTAPSLNVWHNIVMVYNSSKQLTIYVDGVEPAQTKTTGVGDLVNDSAITLYFGRDGLDGASVWKGLIDEARVYNRALSTSEVAYLFTRGNPEQRSKTNAPQNNRYTGGLVGFWSFNGPDVTSTSSPTATDVSGNSNLAALISGPQFIPGFIGQAVTFDGSDDYLDIEDSSSLDLDGDLTISMWINPAANAAQASNANILRKEDSSQNTGFGIESTGATTNNYYFGWKSSGNHCWATGAFTLTANTWQHLVIQKSGTTRQVFINGVDVGADCTASSATIGTNGASLQVGGWTIQGARDWEGSIDELRFYNRALSVAEIQEIYIAGRRE